MLKIFVSIVAMVAARGAPKFGVDLDDVIDIHPPFVEPPKLWETNPDLPLEHQVI
jgi:hypothetical protein